MNRRSHESTSLAAAAGVLAAAGAAGVVMVLSITPPPIPLLGLVLALVAACAMSLLWIGRLCALRDDTAGAARQLRADEAGQQPAAVRAFAISELKLQEIVSIMPMPLFIKDAQSRVLMMNKAAEQQFGFDFSAVSGSNGRDLFPPEQMAVFLANDLAAFRQGHVVVQEDLAYSHARSENRHLRTFKKPVFDAATGEPHCLICVSVDVTEPRRAEQALQHSCLQLRQLMAHLESAKDEQHRSLAAEIHDDLGQNLMALKIDIQMLHARAGSSHPLLKRKAGNALDTVDASIRSVRQIINELHPSTLELGLPAALEWLTGQFEARSGIATTLCISGTDSAPLGHAQIGALFRIVQEVLLDIVQHAGAMQVEVKLAFGAAQLSITVVDDGVAAAEHGPASGHNLGMRVIRERVEIAGGRMLVERRSAGAGTCLSIMMPMQAVAVELGSLE